VRVPGQEWDIGDPEPTDVICVIDDFAEEGDPDSPQWGRTVNGGDWKGYKNGGKVYLTWPVFPGGGRCVVSAEQIVTTTLGNVNQGGIVDRLVECPLCKGDGCVVCYGTGVVKQRNLDRARENSGWSEAALLRLWYMVTTPLERRRARIKAQRAWLEQNEPPSRLDNLDWERRRPPGE
jgi:hypothetical protein